MRAIFTASLFFFSVPTLAGTIGPLFERAVMLHESHGNDDAVGDRHLPKGQWAYGCFQVRQVCLDDVNRRYGTHFRASDCLGNRALSLWIFRSYLKLYATRSRLGHVPTNEDMARIWNGGPDGWKHKSTRQYWRKVCQILRALARGH